MFNTFHTSGQDHGANPGQDQTLNGWSSRLGMSFEEFEAIMAIGSEDDGLQPMPLNIAAGFVC